MRPCDVLWSAFLFAVSLLFQECHAYRENGTPCLVDFQCNSGYCHPTTRECNAQQSIGTACPPGVSSACDATSNLICRTSDNTCQPIKPVGSPCTQNADCQDSYCERDKCLAYKEVQDICFSVEECGPGKRCWGFNPYKLKCDLALADGEDCKEDQDCLQGYCDSANGQCQTRQANGGSCTEANGCVSLRCEDGACIEPLVVGSACTNPSDCYSGVCVGTCGAPVPAPAPAPAPSGSSNSSGSTGSDTSSGSGGDKTSTAETSGADIASSIKIGMMMIVTVVIGLT